MVNGGCISNVYVPNISANLLSINQIWTSGTRKTILFTPHGEEIWSLKETQSLISQAVIDNDARLYVLGF